MKRFFVALCGAALLAGAAGAGAQDDKFISFDRNRDGFLSPEEFTASGDYERAAFDKADDNKDGKLSPSEFLKARTADRPKREGKSAAVVEDALITTKVKAALLKEPNLKSVEVNVDTENGRVTLSGRVQSAADRERMLKIASSVDGVTGVKDGLTVR